MWKFLGRGRESGEQGQMGDSMKILKKGPAMRVIFFYPGEEGTYVDHAHVTLYENGIVHMKSNQEETTTHLQNCEILWNFEVDAAEERNNKVRLLKPKTELRSVEADGLIDGHGGHGGDDDSTRPDQGKPGKGSPKNPSPTTN